MGKAESFQDLSIQPIREGQELWRWLYMELRAAILDGRLKPGSRIPSSRALAQQYSLSRGTVTAAFDQLRSEGYIGAQTGAGSFIANPLPDESVAMTPAVSPPVTPQSTATLSNRGRFTTEGIRLLPASHSLGKAFRSYEPAIDLFPVDLWSRVAGRVLRRAPRSSYGQGDALGYLPLRRAIAEYVGAARGVRCHAGQIIVTSGAQQALDLIFRLLLDPDDEVWIEDPGYPGAHYALRAAGARAVPVPVDAEGLDVASASALAPNAKLAYVTPSNQFPIGITMSQARREALLTWAAREGSWIIEDEYDAEYRYSGSPVASLRSLDSAGAVIYVGTFTKMLFNSLRLGFVVLPERVVDAFAAARSVCDRHPPTLDQAILAEFILEGYFGHHVRRMRQIYSERMSVLAELGERHLKGALRIVPAVSGMRTVAWIESGESDLAITQLARSHGLELAALSEFTVTHKHPPGLIMGFAGCTPAELRRGVELLATVMHTSVTVPTRSQT